MTIALSTIGSRGVTLTIGPSALPEAPNGVALKLTLHDGPRVLTLTRDQASALATELTEQLRRDARDAMMATLTLPGADIRGYYHQLGIQLPERTNVEACACAASRTPARTAAKTATRPARSTSSTAPGNATAAAPAAARTTPRSPRATHPAARST